MKLRRAEDQRYRLALMIPALGAGADSGSAGDRGSGEPPPAARWTTYEWQPGSELQPKAVPELESDLPARVLLLDSGGGDALLVAGAEVRRLPRGGGTEDLLERATRGAVEWERERARNWRWLRLPEQLHTFSDRMNRANTVEEIRRVVADGVASIVGGYTALLLLGDHQPEALFAARSRLCAREDHPLVLHAHPRLWRPGVVTAAEASARTGGPMSILAPLFTDTGAAAVAHVPVGAYGLVVLVERRRDRAFDAEDWTLFQILASQAEGALRRVYSLEQVHELSLTDPLTGLANRRHVEVVMEHAWAGARRGKPLTVVLVDLDEFKRINDEQGHQAGDRVLRLVAEVLREEVRGADLAARYGGDEFLVLLPGESARGAFALVNRIQRRLAGKVGISAGVAEYSSDFPSAQAMIEAADSSLYSVKRRLRRRE